MALLLDLKQSVVRLVSTSVTMLASQRAVLSNAPYYFLRGAESDTKQLWVHRNMLTDYQVWVTYRLATLQLNLYCVGKEHDQGCPLDDR
ncbi:hypothetical protein GQ600_11987 [Phytophthora cactorum]|nr:hypothetical protein GQ600_11987 [Phytophthora cactorum]